MNQSYLLKNQSSLRRKVIAGGFAATFSVSAFSSYIGASEVTKQQFFSENFEKQGESKYTQQEEYFKTLEKFSTGKEGEIKTIKYTDPNGCKKVVKCRLRDGKMEFNMVEEIGDLSGYKGYWTYFFGYEGEKDNKIVGFIRDNWDLIDGLSNIEVCEIQKEKFSNVNKRSREFLNLPDLISFAKKEARKGERVDLVEKLNKIKRMVSQLL